MATVPKAAPTPAPASVTASRRAGPPTRVASVNQGVDELQTNTGVSFNAAAFGFREEDRPSFDQRGGGRGPRHHGGLIDTPTQSFAQILESAETVVTSELPGSDVNTRRFEGLVAKAIAIYETNAAVISGNSNVLGTSVSVVL